MRLPITVKVHRFIYVDTEKLKWLKYRFQLVRRPIVYLKRLQIANRVPYSYFEIKNRHEYMWLYNLSHITVRGSPNNILLQYSYFLNNYNKYLLADHSVITTNSTLLVKLYFKCNFNIRTHKISGIVPINASSQNLN